MYHRKLPNQLTPLLIIVFSISHNLLFSNHLDIKTSEITSSNNTSKSDTLLADLSEIRIVVNRASTPQGLTPFSITLWSQSEAQRITTPATSLESRLRSVPGIYISNRENYSLGERLSIRGMGWRSSFGVRGIHVLLDGIPLTSPDGQTILEIADPNLLRSAQIIRGPNAIFWGNGSGGTMYLSNFDSNSSPLTSVRSFYGSYGTHQTDITIQSRIRNTDLRFSASNFETQGFREHSTAVIRRVGLGARTELASDREITYHALGVLAPEIRNPGSLTAAELNLDRSKANQAFIPRRAGKYYAHFLHGATFSRYSDEDRLDFTVHNAFRKLENPILNSIIGIDRLTGGTRLSYTRNYDFFRLLSTADAAIQLDNRTNHVNNDGNKGNLTVDQRETLKTLGIAIIGQFDYLNWGFSGGVRYDLMDFSVRDNLYNESEPISEENPDNSGERAMSAISPQFGLTYSLPNATFYAGFSTSFESPTTTELANSADGSRGFNLALNPEYSRAYDFGIRGFLSNIKVRYDVSVFQIFVTDRLNGFESPVQPGRTVFENTGTSLHSGLELQLEWLPTISAKSTSDLTYQLKTGYTYHRLEITSDENGFQGNAIPGIPAQRLNIGSVVGFRGFYVSPDVVYHGQMYADNANSVKIDDYFLVDVRISAEFQISSKVKALTFVQIRNLTNTEYNGSVSINAFGGRYYEPSAPRNYLGGIALQF